MSVGGKNMKGTRSITSTILWRLIPGLIFFVVSTGAASYILSAEQLKSNAYASIYDTVSQTKNYLNDRLSVLLAAVVAMSNSNVLPSSNADLMESLNRSEDPGYVPGPSDYIVLNQALNHIVLGDYYDMVDSVVLWYNNGAVSLGMTDHSFPLPGFTAEPYLRSAEAGSPATVFWRNLHDRDIPPQYAAPAKVATLYEWLGPRGPHPKGVFIVNMNEQFFREILNAPKISDNGYLLLASPDGIMRFKTVDAKFRLEDEQLRKLLQGTQAPSGRLDIRSAGGSRLSVIYDTIGANRWKIAAVFPEEELLSKVNYIKYLSAAVILAAILFALLFSNVLARYISRPIKHLTKQVSRIEEGNLNVATREWPQYEMVVLNNGLKEMVERIKALLHQVEEEQELKRQIEISLLQAQIQPHFLYNTLFSIKQLCDMGEVKDASRMITALATFFRISISKGEEVIPIAQELEQVETYLFIQQMRYGDTFRYEIDVDPDVLACTIVKLTLQPIVENAIYHGIKKSERPGWIRISGSCAGDHIVLRVADNGVGIDAEKLAGIRQGLADKGAAQAGFGISNVHKRLQMNYGPDYGLHYESEAGAGTVVTVTIRKVPHKQPE
jgi:two-component system sensor histidine kinase YesM